MRREKWLAGVALILVGIGASSPARSEMRWGFGAFGGYSTYSMSDINNLIGSINTALAVAGAPVRLDEINGGMSFGGGLRAIPSESWRLSLDYERLMGSSEIELGGDSFEINTPANVVSATAAYLFPASGKARFGLGAGPALYLADGSIESVDSSGTESSSFSGTGVGLHLLGVGEIAFSPKVHLELGAGYRVAKASLSVDDVETDADLDWSGFMSRVGLAFYLR
jgi:hypothetical protein